MFRLTKRKGKVGETFVRETVHIAGILSRERVCEKMEYCHGRRCVRRRKTETRTVEEVSVLLNVEQ